MPQPSNSDTRCKGELPPFRNCCAVRSSPLALCSCCVKSRSAASCTCSLPVMSSAVWPGPNRMVPCSCRE
eukprot:6435498-Pyramimonas_sp.AAC.1